MARIITQLDPPVDREQRDISHVVSEGSEESYAEDKGESLFGRVQLVFRHNI